VIAVSLLHVFRFVADGNQNGLGLDALTSADRTISVVAQGLPDGTVIASNDPWLVWWARRDGAVLDFPPSRSEWPIERVQSDIERVTSAVQASGEVVVLLDRASRASISIDEFTEQGVAVRELGGISDVEIWELTPGT
jgi:hypothetical protein